MAPERRPREASGVERKRESRRKSKLPLVAGIAVAALVAVVGIFAFTQVNANPYADSIGNSRISDTVVGEDVLAAVARDKDNKTLTLTRCQVGDEAIAQIAQMEGLEKLYLNECIGYTSLDPLAENESLQGICIEGYDGFDGDAMMSVEFPHVTELAFKLVRFKGTSGFLNHFPALEELELSPQEGIGDIEFLASCPNMATLTVDGMDLSGDKWKPLAGCSELYYVSLNYCNLDTLEWAANCYKLYTVKAVGNSITTLEGLQSSESLNEAYLNDNQISDISALSESTSLYTLSLSGNQIADVSAIRNANQLRRLGLADNQLTDESAASLGELTSLEQLDVSGNQLTNLDFCERLIGLKALSAHDNAIVSIDKLASCSSLEDLFLQHNQIASIDALGNDFENLEELNIAYNQISSLAPLAGNGALKDLVANDNQITSLEGMENKPSLGAVLLDNNQISDISGLSGSIGKLWFLDLGHNQVSDVSLLSGMGTTYEGYYDIVLLLDHNQVTNVDMLPAIGHWRALALYANPLESISFLDNESFEWNAVYIPHSDSFDYATVQGLGGFLADLKIVDCPYDAQAKIVRDIDEAGTGSAYPLFITGEEADADLLALREELNSRVSGEGTAASEIEKPSMDEEGEEAAEGSEGQEGAGIAKDDAAAEGAESEG